MISQLQISNSNPWYVIIVKTRYEKKVTEQLARLGIEVYCPFKKEIRQWSDRKKKVEVPLFLNYVFVRLPERQRDQVFSVPGIVKYLYYLGKPALVRPKEIETIKSWLADDNVASIVLNHLTPGKIVTIEKGLLKNKSATIQQVRKNELKLVLHDLGVVVLAKIKDVA